MTTQRALKARIAQLTTKGEIAPPNTWISSYNVKKKGKKYTYYRLMKADPARSQGGKVRGKMVQYLGSADSLEYKKMKKMIERRNQLQTLLRKLQALEQLEKKVGGGKLRRQQPPLTNLVVELMAQVQTLQTELNYLKSALKNQLQVLDL